MSTQEKIDLTVMYAAHEAFRRDLERLEAVVEKGRAGSPQVLAGWENFKHQLRVRVLNRLTWEPRYRKLRHLGRLTRFR
jgi:hypothetical protein